MQIGFRSNSLKITAEWGIEASRPLLRRGCKRVQDCQSQGSERVDGMSYAVELKLPKTNAKSGSRTRLVMRMVHWRRPLALASHATRICSDQSHSFSFPGWPGSLSSHQTGPRAQKVSVVTDIVAKYPKRKRLLQTGARAQTGLHFEAFYMSWISL
jgi:hypothetical protein